ncbi:MAG: signal peptidase I [Desulforhopalus sp.]|jgi:signal peptidase I
MASSPVRDFFLPSLNKRFFIRVVLLGLASYVVFGHLLIPLRIQGQSMEPSYHDRSFAFCWRLQYVLRQPEHYDVVTVRFAGRKVMLLKRIVALQGETVEFRKGLLFVDGKVITEPYVHYRSDWNLPPRTVASGHVYVVGDNRGTSMARHQFGEINMDRIVGGVIP